MTGLAINPKKNLKLVFKIQITFIAMTFSTAIHILTVHPTF